MVQESLGCYWGRISWCAVEKTVGTLPCEYDRSVVIFSRQDIEVSLQTFTTNWCTCAVMWRRILDVSENTLEMPSNYWNVVLGKAGEDRLDRSCGKVLQTANEDRNVLNKIKRRKANWIGRILQWDFFLKDVIEGKVVGKKWREDEEEDVRSYWMTLRKRKDTGELAVVDPMDLSQDRLGDDGDDDDDNDDVRWRHKDIAECQKMVQRGRKCLKGSQWWFKHKSTRHIKDGCERGMKGGIGLENKRYILRPAM